MAKNIMTQLTQAVLVLGFNNFSGADLAAFAAAVIAAMTGNPYFATPVPAITDIQQLLTDYNTAAAAAESRDRNAVITKTLARLALISGLQNLGRYCMSVANGDRQMLESTGFQLAKKVMASQHRKCLRPLTCSLRTDLFLTLLQLLLMAALSLKASPSSTAKQTRPRAPMYGSVSLPPPPAIFSLT